MAMKFDPTINLGHVLTLAGVLAVGVASHTNLDKRVTVQEERDLQNKGALKEIKDDMKEVRGEMRELRTAVQMAIPKTDRK